MLYSQTKVIIINLMVTRACSLLTYQNRVKSRAIIGLLWLLVKFIACNRFNARSRAREWSDCSIFPLVGDGFQLSVGSITDVVALIFYYHVMRYSWNNLALHCGPISEKVKSNADLLTHFFPTLTSHTLLAWVLFGWSDCLPQFWFIRIITQLKTF